MSRNLFIVVAALCVWVPAPYVTHATIADIVLVPADATDIHGRWSVIPEATASTGIILSNDDIGWSNPNSALAQPTDYVDFTFTAQSDTPYRVWLRLRATGNSKSSDSVYVQFSSAIAPSTPKGKSNKVSDPAPRYRIGTTEGLVVTLQSCNNCAIEGWGWTDGSYSLSQPTTLTFATSGSHILRVQPREDGVQIDQIVLSPERYLTSAPGSVSRDTTTVLAPARTPSTPMAGIPTTIPGVILAENFDDGPAGVAYHDTTAGNSGGAYRQTDVDLQPTAGGGYMVASIAPGEWLNYTVAVAEAGEYRLDARVSSVGGGGTFHVNVDGQNATGPLPVPDTGHSEVFATVSATVALAQGQRRLKVIFDVDGNHNGNLDALTFTSVASAPPPPPPPPDPEPEEPNPPDPPDFTTFMVPTGGDVQAALNSAQPGDLILLEAGATFVGNFVLPAKTGDGFITIRSSASDALLPPAGTRIDPSDAPHLPKLRSPNSASVLATAPYAHHYRLQFLEFMANATGAGDIIKLGDGSAKQNTLAVVPYELIVDRVYIHGDAAVGQKRGIALNSASTAIINSYISDIKAVGQDSQAICGWNGPGPYLIDNNYLEGAGENVLFGGADPAIPDLVPSDITITRNHLFKPWSWRGSNWLVKNLFELKNAQRVFVDGNLMENNWLAGQVGYAILLKSVNQDGNAPWSVVQEVVFSNNVVRHVAGGINILDREHVYPAVPANRITFRNNLLEDVSATKYGGTGRFLQIIGGTDLTLDHNTVINDGAVTVSPEVRQTFGLVFTNNLILDNLYGIKGAGTPSGNATITTYFPDSQFLGSIMVGSKAANYPVANFYPLTVGDVGFADYAGGDYRLGVTSIYRGGATDGTDPGADFAALATAYATVR
jgi:hypothetical protein